MIYHINVVHEGHMSDVFVGKKHAIRRERKESSLSIAKKATVIKSKGPKKKARNPKGKRASMGTVVSRRESALRLHLLFFLIHFSILLFLLFAGWFEGVCTSWHIQM